MLNEATFLQLNTGFLIQCSSFLLLYLAVRWVVFGTRPPKFLPGPISGLKLLKKILRSLAHLARGIWHSFKFVFHLVVWLPRICFRGIHGLRHLHHLWHRSRILALDNIRCPHCQLAFSAWLPQHRCEYCKNVNTAIHLAGACHFCHRLLMPSYPCPHCGGTISLRRVPEGADP